MYKSTSITLISKKNSVLIWIKINNSLMQVTSAKSQSQFYLKRNS